MNTRFSRMAVGVVVAAGAWALRAEVIVKANNTDALNLPTSWIGGAVPGTNDVAQWDYNVTSGQTYALGTNLVWQGLLATATCSNGFTLGSGQTLELGASGMTIAPAKTFTFSCGLVAATDQTWNVAGTLIPQGGLEMAGHTVTLTGSGKKEFKNGLTGGGRIVNSGAGAIFLTGSSATAPTTDIELNGDNITFSTSLGLAAGPRTKSLTLKAATVNVGGSSTANSAETNANALTVGTGGISTVTVTPNAAKNAQFYSGSLSRPVGGGMLFFRGTGLGTNSLEALTPNSANVVFGAPPAQLGAGGVPGSTTNSVLAGVYADTSASGSGIGLAAYDSAYGLRPLDPVTEYAQVIVDGQAQLDNVRMTNGLNVVQTNTLTAATTVNSLSFNMVSGTNTQNGIRLQGPGALTLNSGVIFGMISASATSAGNSFVISNSVLDLGGQEGVFFTLGTGTQGSGSHGGATLDLSCVITNDGGKGVTIGGSSTAGIIKFSGAFTNRYTGDTRCNGGYLWLARSGVPLPGDLVVNGGWVQNTGNQIPNDRDLYVNGGSYNQRGGDWNSGSGAWETFRDLYMTGGSYSDGADGTSSGKTYLTNAVLAGGAWTVTQGHTTEVGKNVSFSGGTLQIKSARDSSNKTTMSIFGEVTITNLLDGAYAPLSVNSSAGGYAGGKLILYGDLNIVCNGMNTNAVTISTTAPSAGSGAGLVALNGTRLFAVGDGAAAVDAVIGPVLVDNGATVGSLTKDGAGTLVLAATNGYTGATLVSSGVLQIDGSLSSPVTVTGGATLCGTGLVSVTGTALAVAAGGVVNPGAVDTLGTLSVTGDVSFASAAVLQVDVSGAFADCLAVSGAVASAGAVVEKRGEGTGPWRILTASSITGSFAAAERGLVVYTQAAGTELWLGKSKGTLISLY